MITQNKLSNLLLLSEMTLYQLLDDHNVSKLFYKDHDAAKLLVCITYTSIKGLMSGGLMHDIKLHRSERSFSGRSSMSSKLLGSIARL